MSSPSNGTLSRNRIGAPVVVSFVLTAAAPLVAAAGVVTLGLTTPAAAYLPLAFLALALVLGLFCVGYLAMSRHLGNPGALYAYVARGLGRPLGVGAAFAAIVAYSAIQVGLYGLIGAATEPLLRPVLGGTPPWWVLALVAWAIVGLVGVLRIGVNAVVVGIVLLAEVALLIAYAAVPLADPAGGPLVVEQLLPEDLMAATPAAVGAAIVIALLGLIGFETAAQFVDRGRHPRRTVPVASYLALLLLGLLGAASALALSVSALPASLTKLVTDCPDGSATDPQCGQGVGTLFTLAGEGLPNYLVTLGLVLLVTVAIAAAAALHQVVARYLFALGRERVLPEALSRTGRRSGAAKIGSLTASALGLAVIVTFAALDLDPLTDLLLGVGTAGSLGLLLLLTLTALSVVVFFIRVGTGENIWRRGIAPWLALLGLLAASIVSVPGYARWLAPTGDIVAWLITAAGPALGLLGLVWAVILRARRPEAYGSIGLGANSATGLAGQSRVVPVQYAAQHGR